MPRETLFSQGPASLSDSELLAAILGSGIKGKNIRELAKEVLEELDSKGSLLKPEHLLQINGLGKAKTSLLCAAFEFFRRIICPAGTKIRSPADTLPLLRHYADRKQEIFLCLSLNGAHEVIAVRVVSIGLVNRTVVHPREVFADPIQDRAAAVMVAHNHPSGCLEPSTEDHEVTFRLKQAGEILGIQLLDHLIFSRTGYFSFMEERILE